MPTTKDIRSIKITANTGGVTASDFDVTFDAEFTTAGGVTLNFTDSSDGSCDRTLHELVFTDPATGSELGRTSILVKVDTKELDGFTASIDRSGRSDITPPAAGPATVVREPASESFRRWAQVVKQGGDNVLRNFANVDTKSVAAGSVDQTVRENGDSSYVLAVSLSAADGTSIASGSVNVTTAATAGAGYTLGPVRLSESEDDGPVERTVLRR